MGKIVGKLNRDLGLAADDILRAAATIITKGTEYDLLNEALDEKLQTQLETLTRFEFDGLLDLLEASATAYADEDESDSILNLIDDALERLTENFTVNGKYGALVSMTVELRSKTPAWFIKISPAIGEQIAEILQKSNLISPGSTITFMPRILSAKEGLAAGFHEVYNITRLLSMGETAAAMQIITQARLKSDMGFAPPESTYSQESTSAGLLTFFVTSEVAEPFPVHRELSQSYDMTFMMEDIDDNDIEDNEDEIADAQFLMSIGVARAILANAARSIANILTVGHITFSSAPSNWYDSIDEACHLDRLASANLWVEQLVSTVGAGQPDTLRFKEDVDLSSEPLGFEIHFFNMSKPNKIHTLFWPALDDEIPDDCIHAVEDFLQELSIEAEAPPESMN